VVFTHVPAFSLGAMGDCRQWLRPFWAAPFILPSESHPQNRLFTAFSAIQIFQISRLFHRKYNETRPLNMTQNLPLKPKGRDNILSHSEQ